MMRALLCVVIAAGLFAGSVHRAAAETEFCPASLYYKPVGNAGDDKPASMYGFTLNASGARTVTAVLAFETGAGWFKASAPTTTIVLTGQQYFASPVMYVRFATPVQIVNAFVLGANGQACPPLQRPHHVPNENAGDSPDLQYPAPVRVPPRPGMPILDAIKTAPLFNTTCAQPFQDASLKTIVSPEYPEEVQLHAENGTTYVRVILNPGGSLASASIAVSSEKYVLDQVALKAAQQSTYQSAVAYCQPRSGELSF